MQSRGTDEAGSADQERHLNHGRQWANRDLQTDRRQLSMRRPNRSGGSSPVHFVASFSADDTISRRAAASHAPER